MTSNNENPSGPPGSEPNHDGSGTSDGPHDAANDSASTGSVSDAQSLADEANATSGPDGEFDANEVALAAEKIAAAAALTPDQVLLVINERDQYLDGLRRLQADFENYRKRSLRDQDAAADRAGEKVINRLLPVLDTFELGLKHEQDGDNSPLGKMYENLLLALQGEGLERIAPTGQPFDPNQADAVMHEPGDDGVEPVVSEVLRAGYSWKGRVMRAAMVKVKG